MATKKKMLQAAAGNATGGAGLDITDVFSTYLFKPNTSGTYPIVNNIDLDAEGGMVWMKRRDYAGANLVHDTERWGGSNGGYLRTDSNNGSASTAFFSSFNSDGFTPQDLINQEMASWTFRKAPKFFDVVTWTGDGVSGRTITHNLGSTPGFAVIKRTSDTSDWWVYHRSAGATLELNTTGAAASTNNYDGAAYTWTDTQFTVGAGVVGQNSVNANNSTYVAYLFAHNDGDGEFGPDADQDIIKCGSFTGPSATVNLGFEPEWILMKDTAGSSNWIIYDAMRGMPVGSTPQELYPNTSGAESLGGNFGHVSPSPTGFSVGSGYSATYIYMAIRRGPLAPPESGTEVFEPAYENSTDNPRFDASFPVDMAIQYYPTGGSSSYPRNGSRLTGTDYLVTSSSVAAGTTSNMAWDYMQGFFLGTAVGLGVAHMWKRAPNFFDVVAYTGDGTTGRTVSHNLGVAPEMMWVKKRSSGDGWAVYHKDLTSGNVLGLNTTDASYSNANIFTTTSPTDSVFSVGSDGQTNLNSSTYIAYLFASLDGVSKVGSYTGTGAAFNVDCGFTSGARFVLIKRTDSTGDWGVFDTERGITDSSSPLLRLNNTTAEANFDYLDPYSGGFAHSGANSTFNTSGETYIFYAIA